MSVMLPPLAAEPAAMTPAPDPAPLLQELATLRRENAALRPAVLWRKGSFGSDSDAGSHFVERLLTVVASCRQQGRSLVVFLVAAAEAALRGSAPPSLVSAPRGH
jgi:hypothetical protein